MEFNREIDHLIVTLSNVRTREKHFDKVLEEMFELGTEITKKYKLGNRNNIIEELVDVINSCEVLLHNLTGSEMNELRIKKLEKGIHYAGKF